MRCWLVRVYVYLGLNYLFIYLFIEDLYYIAQSTAQGFSQVQSAHIEYNTIYAHYNTKEKHIHIIRKLVPSVLLSY